MSILMTPDMANFSGNVHGIFILKLLDQVAYACVSRYSNSYATSQRWSIRLKEHKPPSCQLRVK